MINRYSIICCVVFLSVLFSCKREQRGSSENASLSYEEYVKAYVDKITLENINKPIDLQEFYWGTDNLNPQDISSLISRHKFFFYFSDQTCPPCILSTVDCIKEIFPDYKQDPEIIFISPDFPVRLKENCHGKRLLTLTNGKLGIPLEELNVPFIFTLNDKLAIEKLHVVNKNDFTKTTDFLKIFK